MVEGQHLVEEHQTSIRNTKLILCQRRQFLDLTDNVVCKEAHSPSRKGRQRRQTCGSVSAKGLLQLVENIPFKDTFPASLAYRDPLSARNHLLVWLNADEGITPNMLAPFDRFQQKRLRFLRRNPQKC